MTTTVQTTEAQALPEAPGKIESVWTSFVPMILIFGVFYFLLIRPQEKKRKEHENLISSVKKGEEVITTGGIYGKVIKVSESESTAMIEIAENTVIKISKASILEILGRKSMPAVKSEKSEIENKEEKTKSSKAKKA